MNEEAGLHGKPEERKGNIEYALVVDDHPLVVRGVAEYLISHCGYPSVHSVADGDACMAFIADNGAPNLVIIDFWLADGAAPPLVKALSDHCPATRLLVMSGDDGVGIDAQARDAGAHGFIHKNESPETFARAVTALRRGKTWFPDVDPASAAILRSRRELLISPADLGLTRRQGEVLAMMLKGLPNKRIAMALNVTEQTVKEHVSSILQKLGASNRVEAIALLHGRRLRL